MHTMTAVTFHSKNVDNAAPAKLVSKVRSQKYHESHEGSLALFKHAMLLQKTGQRLKQLISSKKSIDVDGPAHNAPQTGRRSSRPHSWISTSSRVEQSHSPPRNREAPTPRIEPPAMPRAKSAARQHSTTSSLYSSDCHECDASTPRSLSAGAEFEVPRSPSTSCRQGTRRHVNRHECVKTENAIAREPSQNAKIGSLDRLKTMAGAEKSTFNLFEALTMELNEMEDIPTTVGTPASLETTKLISTARTAWSDDVEQLIRETDQAFKAVGFALTEAKEITKDFPLSPINQSTARVEPLRTKEGLRSTMRIKSTKSPLSRNSSTKTAKPKRKKSAKKKERRVVLQAFPPPPTPSPRWTLPEVTGELFNGRIFSKVEADELARRRTIVNKNRLSRESLEARCVEYNEKRHSKGPEAVEPERQSQERNSCHSGSTVDRTTPVEPFHLEELADRLSRINDAESQAFNSAVPQPPSPPLPQPTLPLPPLLTKDGRRLAPVGLSIDSTSPSHRSVPNTTLPPIPAYSPISPPTPTPTSCPSYLGASPLISPPTPTSCPSYTTSFTLEPASIEVPSKPSSTPPPPSMNTGSLLVDEDTVDPLQFGKLKFPAPPSQHRFSRSRSATCTSLATIREDSPHLHSTAPLKGKNQARLRSPGSTSQLFDIATASTERRRPALCRSSQSTFNRRASLRRQSLSQSLNSEILQQKQAQEKSNPDELASTPYSLTAPLFKHGHIRLNRTTNSCETSGTGTPLHVGTPRHVVCSEPVSLDWTAFQIAIAGGAGNFFDTGNFDNVTYQQEMDQDIDDILDWWLGFGFAGRDKGIGRVMSAPPKAKKKIKKPSRPRPDTQLQLAELPGSLVLRAKEIDRLSVVSAVSSRPFSFCPGSENEISVAKRSSGHESDDSLPTSPMEEISPDTLDQGKAVLGFNLGHDLPDFLRWESMIVQNSADCGE